MTEIFSHSLLWHISQSSFSQNIILNVIDSTEQEKLTGHPILKELNMFLIGVFSFPFKPCPSV
jgi:hypothetical protein